MSNELDDFGAKATSGSAPSIPSSNSYSNEQSDPEDINSQADKMSQWMPLGNNIYKGCPITKRKLDSGMYCGVQIPNGQIGLEKLPINIDELLNFPDSQIDKILQEIKEFWSREQIFKKYGFLHRRGYMFYGPHGSGKSSLVQQIIAQICAKEQDGLVLLCDDHPKFFNGALSQIRAVEPNRPLVCIFEDIDAIIKKYGESEILSILDGENQVDKVLNIATTNYPEHLDPRIVARPRRFDRVIRIDWPAASVRRHYFKHKLKIDDAELDKWVSSTEKFSFAACAELVISVKCLDLDFDKTVDKLRKLNDVKKPNSDEYKDSTTNSGNVGFGK
jgi:hypothetical protein